MYVRMYVCMYVCMYVYGVPSDSGGGSLFDELHQDGQQGGRLQEVESGGAKGSLGRTLCMYVCMYVYMYVCMQHGTHSKSSRQSAIERDRKVQCMNNCMNACMYVFTYVCMYVCTVCMYVVLYKLP